MYEQKSLNDDDMKPLVFYLENTSNRVFVPMLWKYMRDFLNQHVIPNFVKTKGTLNLCATELA